MSLEKEQEHKVYNIPTMQCTLSTQIREIRECDAKSLWKAFAVLQREHNAFCMWYFFDLTFGLEPFYR